MPLLTLSFLAVAVASSLMVASARADESSSDISARIEAQQKQLDAARQELDQINDQILQQERNLDRNRMELADATTRLSEAEDRYSASLDQFNNRITAIYKLGRSELYTVVLSSDDFADSMSRLSYLGTISENDLRLLERVKAEEAETRALRQRVDELKQAKAEDLQSLQQKQLDLQQQIATGQTRVEADAAELTQAQAREQEEEARRQLDQALYEQDGFGLYGGVMGPSVLMGSSPPPGLQPSGIVLNGRASWYGPGFHGNHTANGEIYNMYALTAAHKSLPFGTWLKVTYNGRSVFVRINDRGPYVAGRFLDLSAGSAQAIGLTGVGYVTAEIYR